jgi:hypothetical protein
MWPAQGHHGTATAPASPATIAPPRLSVSGVTTILGVDHVQLAAPPGCEERRRCFSDLCA